MNQTRVAFVVGTLFCMSAAAQAQTAAQAGTQTNTQASVQAGQKQASASGNASADASASRQNGPSNSSLASGTAFNAELTSPVDSKKCKPGDPVKARTTEAARSEGKTVIPRGSTLVGHVTQASARAKGDGESSLGIVFDKAILKNGEEVRLNVAIEALAASQHGVSGAGSDVDTMAGGSAMGSGSAGGRSALGGVTSTSGSAAGGAVRNTAADTSGMVGRTMQSTGNVAGNAAGNSAATVGGLNAAGQLTSNSRGVFGLNGLNLNAAGSEATQGSVITSSGKNIHLDNGTRILLVSQTQAGTDGESKPGATSKPEPKSRPEKQR